MVEIDRQYINLVNNFKLFVKELEINSPEDIPDLKDLTTKFRNGEGTLRDAWFAKMYTNGVKIPKGIINYTEDPNIKKIAETIAKKFPSQKDTKARIVADRANEGLLNQITSVNNKFRQKGVNNPLGQKYDPNMFDDTFTRNFVSPLKKATETVSQGLKLKKQAKSKIMKNIPTNEMMSKILEGLKYIKDPETQRLVMLGLFGTRGEQIKQLASDQDMGEDLGRPYYDRKQGVMYGVDVETGRKKLADAVPFGPLLKDMMDLQWDLATDNGKIDERSVFQNAEKIDLSEVINKYLFNREGKSVLNKEELRFLGRSKDGVGGFVDLRRMMLSWAAASIGDRKLAAELLTHTTDAQITQSVTDKYYIPAENKTDIPKMREFTTAMEQNIAKILKTKNYAEFKKKINLQSYDTEIKKVKNFKSGKTITVEPTQTIMRSEVPSDVDVSDVDSKTYDQSEAARLQKKTIEDTDYIRDRINKYLEENPGKTEADAREYLGLKKERKGKQKKPKIDGNRNANRNAKLILEDIAEQYGVTLTEDEIEGKTYREIHKMAKEKEMLQEVGGTNVKPESQEFRADDLKDKTTWELLTQEKEWYNKELLTELGARATDPENLRKLASAAAGVAISLIDPRNFTPKNLATKNPYVKTAKFLWKNVIKPGSVAEGKWELTAANQERAWEMYKKTPEYKEHMKNKEAKKRQKPAMDLFKTETAIQEDMNLPEDQRTMGDDDPDSWQNRRIQDQMSELLF